MTKETLTDKESAWGSSFAIRTSQFALRARRWEVLIMRLKLCISSLLIVILTLGNLCPVRAADQAWKRIFDGKTLDGSKAPDMSYFPVEDGAITGQTTREHNPPENQFIVWQGGKVGDFELKFKFRI